MIEGQGKLSGDTVINLLPPARIYLSDMTRVHLLSIRVEGYVTAYSISMENASFIWIQNSLFVGGTYGLNIDNPEKLLIKACEFQNSGISTSDADIHIQDCTFSGGRYGVEIRGQRNITTLVINPRITLTVFLPEPIVITSSCMGDGDGGINCTESNDIDTVKDTVESTDDAGIHIQNCTFSGGQYGVRVSDISGENVSIISSVFKGIEFESITASNTNLLTIQNCTVLGGRFGVFIHSETDTIIIESTTISDTAVFGILFDSVNNGIVSDCTIRNNTMGVTSFSSNLHIQNTNFTENSFGLVIPADSGAPTKVYIANCAFSNNSATGIGLVNALSGMFITNCSFYENQGTPIVADQSSFELRGHNVFKDNNVERGGGLALFNSSVIFGPGSNTKFINNTAVEFGGAIYIATLSIPFLHELQIVLENVRDQGVVITNTDTILKQDCFYSINNLQTNVSITFIDNEALLGGNDIYGATLYTEDCNPLNNSIFKFSNESVDTYKISSDPTRACFCVDSMSQCENRTYLILNETRYPGETFTTSVTLAGYNFGRVAGTVYTNVLGQNYKEVIRESQHLQSVNITECGTLTYTISSNKTSDPLVLVLTAQEKVTQGQDETDIQSDIHNINSGKCSSNGSFPCTALLTTPIYINVTLEPCPLGFKLNEGKCECDDNLRSNIIEADSNHVNITCEIRDHIGYITREGTVWVGVDTSENETDIYYWHRYCPRDYCIPSQTSIDPRFPDKQCSSNRSGVLCGRCQAGYGVQLGGNKCTAECGNSFLALLIVFALLGILLVALIKLLDLTVTSGTMSGLIFYANVVWSNNAILFSKQDRQSIGYYIITVPIAWINLDFGIETCFSGNLDQLTKTGLQFVFPFYIWCIAGLIIIVSHYSTRATKLFGNNSVAVLSTLFLLSYGKLFRNITDVFAFADVIDSNGTINKVWSLDGNVRYGITPGHIVLIVLALLFLILFVLPFTLTLVLVPFLRAKSHLRPLHWINTLKPFFDTYYGPFKDKKQHQVWTGILLISRVVILIVFVSTSTYSPNANILLMTVIATSLLMYSASVGLPYKKWYLSILEMLYLFNLNILGGAFLFRQTLPQKHYELNPVAATSVVIALFSFVCTMTVYTAKRIISCEKIQSCFKDKKVEEEVNHKESDQPDLEAQEESMGPTIHVIELKKYDPTVFREILLETSV